MLEKNPGYENLLIDNRKSSILSQRHIYNQYFWIRIGIGSGFNPVSGSRRAKMTHKRRKKSRNFKF
jgi:hypothetical protein